jgi:glycine/D-amino acid oxidase-like deaminating enzyme
MVTQLLESHGTDLTMRFVVTPSDGMPNPLCVCCAVPHLHLLQVHPAKLTSALVAAACAKGAKVVTGTVTGITTQPQGQQRLVTGEGRRPATDGRVLVWVEQAHV